MACSTRDSTTSKQRLDIMKSFCTVMFLLSLASTGLASQESMLARVTCYWAGEGPKYASTGRRLRAGHCAVDPRRIPYGSTIVFPDQTCTAVDTGPAVVSRKADRLCGRTADQNTAADVHLVWHQNKEIISLTVC